MRDGNVTHHNMMKDRLKNEADEYREIVCHHCKQKFKILKGYAFMYACPYCRRLLRG